MYGLPVTPLTYEQYVMLTLALPHARAIRTAIQVDAIRIAKGELGQPEFYAIDTGDEKSAQSAYETAMLANALKSVRR